MSNNDSNGDHRRYPLPTGHFSPQSHVSSHPNHHGDQQQGDGGNRSMLRAGLMPTDGHDAYKRAQNRASRRSRSERTSYLVATGHLDPEETERLNKQSDDSGETINSIPQQYLSQPTSLSSALSPEASATSYKHDISEQNSQKSISSSKVTNKRSNFQQSFLDDLNRTLANSPTAVTNLQFHQHHHESQQENKRPRRKDSRKKYKQQLSLYNYSNRGREGRRSLDEDGDDGARGKFRQTFTEVTLPMKTSPAFEYILKDNERRNRRCCLWFLYSTLITICIAVIIFCGYHLVSRGQYKT